ncbi:MAG TPA: type III secretion system export apparatus subunit SctU [Myxococcaceae bacterium]|nr:type III secretion system export apparatus subunit SctU [Myxococcaceae bacterium]
MAESDSGEKTEEPTHKKIEDARKQGQVWKSRDLTSVLVFMLGLGAFKMYWPYAQGELVKFFLSAIAVISQPTDMARTGFGLLYRGGVTMLVVSLPVLLACVAVGMISDFVQVGPLLSFKSTQPQLSRVNPMQGAKNLFSKKQLFELVKSNLKMIVALYMGYTAIRDSIRMVALTVRGDAEDVLVALGQLIYLVVVRIGLLFLLFAIVDVWFQRRAYMKSLMMTKEEIKREYKESEGDPHHKSHRKQMHQEIIEGAQMNAVKGADVVVTNPDHVAVALKYRPGDEAPIILMKGLDAEAEAIKAAARTADISLVRNVPLARALAEFEVGQSVPAELYEAVAEVLAFVYGLQNSWSRFKV